jgi:signal transduction histidine kinase
VTAVSHELRSPLAAILGSAMTLEQLDGSLSDEDRRGLVGGIITKAQRLNALVEDLLDLERLRRGVIQIARVRTDLAPVVQASIDAAEIGDRRVLADLAPVTLAADPSMIERMVENLLTNAGRYTPAGSTVWVRLWETPSAGAEIVVEDDGPGVPGAMHAELFDAFRQGPNALAHAPGVGVGLTIVARFAEAHGGRAWVEERSGGGASFHVTIEPPVA